jgi:uncharacterized protein
LPARKQLIRIGAVLCAAALSAWAVDWGALKPEGYVNDFAHVIDANSRAELDRYCRALETSTGVQMALVTLPSLEGEPVEDVANTIFRKWGIGKKGKDEGLLLLLSINDRRSRLEVGYGLEPIVTDGDAGAVLRAMRPYLRQGRYGDALVQAADTLGSKIAQAKGVAIRTPQPRHPRHSSGEGFIPLGIVIGGFLLLALLSSLGGGGRRRGGGGGGFLTGLLLGNLMGRGWGGGYRGGGGGFGGFDSGDGGFGGFGGGDSGGGGASSSW